MNSLVENKPALFSAGSLIEIELKNISKKFIHKPWELKDEKNFKLGRNYPFPLVNHEEARVKALNAFKRI